MIIKTHIVPEGISHIRFSDYACNVFNDMPSRKAVKKAIKRGAFLIDGEIAKTGNWIKSGQRIELLDVEIKPPKPYKLDLEIIYEDEHLAIINKPGGIPVSGNQFKTIQNALIDNITPSQEKNALSWPRPVHRLDSPTCGLLIIAKTATALINLGKQFEKRLIKKRYRAIVMGKIKEKDTIDTPVNGQAAETKFERIDCVPSLRSQWLSLVDLWPLTGRTHQLRIHMAESGFPILGDKIYGTEGLIYKGKGLFLCAAELSFLHPIHNTPITVRIDEPAKFTTHLLREKARWEKYNK